MVASVRGADAFPRETLLPLSFMDVREEGAQKVPPVGVHRSPSTLVLRVRCLRGLFGSRIVLNCRVFPYTRHIWQAQKEEET